MFSSLYLEGYVHDFEFVISLIIWKTALLSQDLMFLSLIYAETILFQTVEGL